MKTTLTLVRHGETDKNVDNKLHEAGDTEKLNEKGVQQVNKTAELLNQQGVDIVYCSKEARAIQSANIIGNVCSSEVAELDGLQERNWGIYANKPWSEVSKVLEGLSLEERYAYVPENGESWKEFEDRLIKVVDQVLKEHAGERVVIITHGGSIRALMPYLLGVPKEESFKYDPANASITTFEYSDGAFTSIVIDDTSHLA
jgi:broad specificity phosphatase PhoE